MMGGIGEIPQPGEVPPLIPKVSCHVAVSGQATGPFDISALEQMVTTGQFSADSLVWKNRMAQWTKAGTMDDPKGLFTNGIPPIPSER